MLKRQGKLCWVAYRSRIGSRSVCGNSRCSQGLRSWKSPFTNRLAARFRSGNLLRVDCCSHHVSVQSPKNAFGQILYHSRYSTTERALCTPRYTPRPCTPFPYQGQGREDILKILSPRVKTCRAAESLPRAGWLMMCARGVCAEDGAELIIRPLKPAKS